MKYVANSVYVICPKYFVRRGDMDNQIPASCGIILCWCIYPRSIWLSDIFSDILAFHVCRDRCSLGLAPISGGFNVKIITVMPIQDKGPRPAQSHYTEAHTTVSHHNWVTRRISADNERVLQVHWGHGETEINWVMRVMMTDLWWQLQSSHPREASYCRDAEIMIRRRHSDV